VFRYQSSAKIIIPKKDLVMQKMYIKVIYVVAIIWGLVSCSPQQIEENVNPAPHAIKTMDLKAIAETDALYVSESNQNQEREVLIQKTSPSAKTSVYYGDAWLSQTGYASSWTGYKIPRANLVDNKLYSVTIQASNAWVTASYLNASGQYVSAKGGWAGVVSQNQVESNAYAFTKADIPTNSDLYIWINPSVAGTFTLRGYQLATGVIEGWASQTGYQNASTTVQKNVVRLANAANGNLSGLSSTDTQSKWLTDCADGDGAKMRKAIQVYNDWFKANVITSKRCSPPALPTATRNNMIDAFAGSAYDATRKTALVNQIVSRYNAIACNASVAVPTDDNGTLSLLAIQKQCLEWAETIGRSAGGQARGYYAAGVSSTKDYRPGMAMYKTDRTHATVLVDIYWNRDGSIGKVRIAEANYANGWMNPVGAIPWERRVNTSRELTSLSGFKVVSFE
jgi:hypothetical protein